MLITCSFVIRNLCSDDDDDAVTHRIEAAPLPASRGPHTPRPRLCFCRLLDALQPDSTALRSSRRTPKSADKQSGELGTLPLVVHLACVFSHVRPYLSLFVNVRLITKRGVTCIAGETVQLVVGSRQFGSQPSFVLPLLAQHPPITLGPFPPTQQREQREELCSHSAQFRPSAFGQQASSASSAPRRKKVKGRASRLGEHIEQCGRLVSTLIIQTYIYTSPPPFFLGLIEFLICLHSL